jgi:hypothetical protein
MDNLVTLSLQVTCRIFLNRQFFLPSCHNLVFGVLKINPSELLPSKIDLIVCSDMELMSPKSLGRLSRVRYLENLLKQPMKRSKTDVRACFP